MKKQILAIALALVLTIGVATAALAAETNGSIYFEMGDVIVNPPPALDDTGGCGCCPECCDCGGECDVDCNEDHGDGPCDCICDCDCVCDCDCDKDFDDFFKKLRVDNNLYFGRHELTVYGQFDSANKAGSPKFGEERYTTSAGKYTGVEVINKSAAEATIEVEISSFKVGGTPTLVGAELTLVAAGAAALGGNDDNPFNQINNVRVTDGASTILKVDSGRAVKAAWSGLLETQPGMAAPGNAQAVLTWTSIAGAP